MRLPFRIQENARGTAPRRGPFPAGGGGPVLPGGGGGPLLEGMDPFAGASAPTFLWDVAERGWDEGSWYGAWESLSARLSGALVFRRGAGTASFARPTTTTRTNRAGATETVAADSPAYDWLAGPGGTERYCLRMDQADALLTLPTERNLSRRRGAVTLWVRPAWAGSPAEGSDRVLLECGDLKLWKPAGATELRWQVPLLDGSNVTAAYSVSAWTADAWHLIGASWDRAAGQVRLWTDGALRDTEVTAQRYAEWDAALGLGQGSAPGAPFGSHLLDFRVWSLPLTATLFETLHTVSA